MSYSTVSAEKITATQISFREATSSDTLSPLMLTQKLSPSSSAHSRCIAYIGAEPRFSSQTQRIIECFQKRNMSAKEANPSSATHFVLFITDSFLKSKEHILPLITHLSDPHFKQRLFPIIMDKISIFRSGEEVPYAQFWSERLKTVNSNSFEYGEIKTIQENIAPFICALRDTLMPPLDELLKTDLAPITDTIEKRSHLLEAQRFFFLPNVSTPQFVGRDISLAELSSLLSKQTVATLSGDSGIGKTTLAVEYAKRSEIYPAGVFWLNATNILTLDESFRQLAIQLGITLDQAKKELLQMKDILLIYDNVSDPTIIKDSTSGHTIIIGPKLSKPDLTLKPFSDQDTDRYLQDQLNISKQEARYLGKILENQPAKLNNAITYIMSAKITVVKYIEFYLYNRNALLSKQQLEGQSSGSLTSSASPQHLLTSILDPLPQTIGKFCKQPVDQLSNQLKDQGIQIFVSYNWGAMDQVEQIDSTFQKMGIELLRDARELRNFESIREFMKKVIREADYTFSIITDPYLKSFNCLFEIITTMKDPNWKLRVFPVVLVGTNLDDQAILGYERHWQQETERLSKAGGSPAEVAITQEGAKKIGTYLRFVNQMQPPALTTQLTEQFQNTMALMLARQETLEKKGIYNQAVFHLPMGRNKDFTGRNREMSRLEESLKSGQYSAITNTGMGGVGKSQLALEYAYRHQKEYEMVYWIRSEHMDTIKADLRMLGQEVGIGEDFLKDDKVISTMKGVLEKQKKWLLIFDNAEDPKALAKVMPQKGGHIIITSRNKSWDKTVSVDVFSKDQALNYLQKITGVTGQDKDLKLLAEELGYLPLALTQAGAYIRKQQIDVTIYLAEYKKEQKKMLSHKEKGYPGSVATAWLMSMEKINREDSNATKLLNICSFLAPENIPEAVLEGWLIENNKIDSGLDFHDALRVLESYSLVDQKIELSDGTHKKTISIHRLIQAVTRDRCEEKEAKTAIVVGLDVLDREFNGKVETKEERNASEALVEHAQALTTHAEEKKIITEKAGSLIETIGAFLFYTGDLAASKQSCQKALNIYKTCIRSENEIVAGSYRSLGVVLQGQGDLAEARVMYDKALKILVSCLKTEEHLDVAKCYNNLGNLLYIQGMYAEAKKMYEKGLNIEIACFQSENHIKIANSYMYLGNVLRAQGELEAAKEMHQKALKIKIASLGTENNILVSVSYGNLGLVLADLEELSEARNMHQKALEIAIACLGTENHTTIAEGYNNLGLALQDQGDHAEAKKMLEKALNIFIGRLGTENHIRVAECCNNLGNVLDAQKEFDAAEAMYQKAVRIKIACFGTENHLSVASSYMNLGSLLQDKGDRLNAKRMYEQALKVKIACHKTENHADVASCYMKLGSLMQDQDDLAGAKRMYEKALKIKIAFYATENQIDVADTLLTLGSLLQDKDLIRGNEMLQKAYNIYNVCLGAEKAESNKSVAQCSYFLGLGLQEEKNFSKSAEMLRKALKAKIASLGTENHMNVARICSHLGDVLRELSDLVGAKEMYQKELSIRIFCSENEHNQDDIELASNYSMLGIVMMDQGDLAEAKEMFEKGLQIRIAHFGNKTNTHIASSYNSLGCVLNKLGKYDEAKEMHQKSLKMKIASYGTENDPVVVYSYNNLALVLENQGKLDEAKKMHQKALAINIAYYKTENHNEVARKLFNLGNVLKAQKDLVGAKELHRKALKIRIAYYQTENHVDVAQCYHNLGCVLESQGELDEAKEMHQKALKIRIACHKTENHFDVAASCKNLGDVYLALKQIKQAQEYYLKAKQIHQHTNGDKFDAYFDGKCIGVGDNYITLGIELYGKGAFAEAQEKYQNALEIFIACFGTENHTNVAITYSNLGFALKAQGELAKANEVFQKALAIRIACHKTENHFDVAASYENLGDVYLALKQIKQAQEYYLKAKQIYQHTNGDKFDAYFDGKCIEVGDNYITLGIELYGKGAFAEAQEKYQNALEIFIACFGTENHINVAITYSNLGHALKAQGELAMANEMFQKALACYIAYHGTENHINVANSYHNSGDQLDDLGDFANANAMYQRALKIKINCLGTEDNLSVADSYTNLGVVLVHQNDFEGAMEKYQKALNIRISCLGTEKHQSVALCYKSIGSLLYDQGKLNEAKEIYQKALEIDIGCHGNENHISVGRPVARCCCRAGGPMRVRRYGNCASDLTIC